MCYHKSIQQKHDELMAHYSASFESITSELEIIKERFGVLMQKDAKLAQHSLAQPDQLFQILNAYSQKNALPAVYSDAELKEMKWCLKSLTPFQPDAVRRYYDNGYDHLQTPIITTKQPRQFTMSRWGLIPPGLPPAVADERRKQTLNCRSDEMFEGKVSFRHAVENGQRCLIPVTGFFEWRHVFDSLIKIPYYITFRDQKPRSMAGLYSEWISPSGKMYHTYTLLTTQANTILDYVHNNGKRMPVFIARDEEEKWLDPKLGKKEILELCRPFDDPAMRAYTITKHLTAPNNINRDTPEVLMPMNYNKALEEAAGLIDRGDKKGALELVKNALAQSKTDEKKIGLKNLELAVHERIAEEVIMNPAT